MIFRGVGFYIAYGRSLCRSNFLLVSSHEFLTFLRIWILPVIRDFHFGRGFEAGSITDLAATGNRQVNYPYNSSCINLEGLTKTANNFGVQ